MVNLWFNNCSMMFHGVQCLIAANDGYTMAVYGILIPMVFLKVDLWWLQW